MPYDHPNEKELVTAFVASLGDIPTASAEVMLGSSAPRDDGFDDLLRFVVNNQIATLVVGVKRRALFPRDIMQIAWKLREAVGKLSSRYIEPLPVIIADTISGGARDMLHRERIGYWDLSESLFLPTRHSFILIDKPANKKQERVLTTVFEGQRSLVLHALWDAGDWISGGAIATKAQVSAATVSETLGELERRGWVDTEGSGPAKVRRLTNTTELLDEWSDYVRSKKPPELRHYYLSARDMDDIIDQVGHAFDDVQSYEITAQAAGQTYAPYLTQVSQVICRCYKPQAAEAILSNLGAKRVSEGWNLGLIEAANKVFPFRQKIGDAYFASPLQTYLDLLQRGGRSKELAENLRRMQLNHR